jgi:hypothetical protein
MRMFRRASVLALVIFELVWLNVIIPGHTRGCVTMPCGCREESSAPAAAQACPLCAAAAEKGSHHSPTPSDREHCALCFFAAHLSIPPVLDLSAPRLGFLAYVGPERAKHLIAREVLAPFDGRGPPTFA